jgi:hypothetical protein
MTVLFCVVKAVGTYCFGNPGGYGGSAAWYIPSVAIAALMVLSSLVWKWGKHIDDNEHIFTFIEAIKLAALFFLILTPEQLAGYQCSSPASLGQVIGPICTPSANAGVIGLQCDPNWYAGAGYNLTTTQLSDLANVCGVPDFLAGYFAMLAAEILTMAYLFIVQKCIFPPRKEMKFGFVVLTGHLILIGLNCLMWGLYELFIVVTYSGGTCKLPLTGNGIVLRAFCSLYIFLFSLILIVLIHRVKTRKDWKLGAGGAAAAVGAIVAGVSSSPSPPPSPIVASKNSSSQKLTARNTLSNTLDVEEI